MSEPSKPLETAPTNQEPGFPPIQQHSPLRPKLSLDTYRDDIALEDNIELLSEERQTPTNLENPVSDRLSRYRGRKNIIIRLWGAISVPAIVASLRSFSFLLLPSFVQEYLDSGHTNSTKIYPTTYLNGIRGLAAFFVYCQHVTDDFYFWVHRGYLATPEDVYVIQWPIVRLIISGRFMVAIFFILSGFVLSYKPVQLIRQNKWPALLENLASSTFRRAPRLFLPGLPPMLIGGVAVYYGIFYVQGPPLDEVKFDPRPSLWSQLELIGWVFFQMINPFTWGAFRPLVNPPLWTLGMEFRGSMVVFVLLLCLSCIKNFIRITLLFAFTFYTLYIDHWEVCLFVIGILLSEYRCIRDSMDKRPFTLHLPNIPHFKLIKVLFFSALLVLSLYIGSWPAFGASNTPGFRFLSTLTPGPYRANEEVQQYFWLTIAATMLLITFESFPIIQAPFVTRMGIYFGDISFAFYVVHWPILYTFGRWASLGLIQATGSYHVGFWLGAMFNTPIVVWVADLWWRWGDQKSVELARWALEKCSVKT